MDDFFVNIGATVDGLVNGMKKAAQAVGGLDTSLGKVASESAKTLKSFDLFERGGLVFEKVNHLTGGFAKTIFDLGEGLVSAFGKGTIALNLFKVALISTGIGALVVAVGLLVAYWDDIVGYVTGVSSALKDQRKILEDNVKTQEKSVELLENSENVLKLQGKSQLQINKLKIDELNTLIDIKRQLLENLITSLDSAKSQENAYRAFFTNLTALATNVGVRVAQTFDSLFGTNLTKTFLESVKAFEDFVIPDLTGELTKDIEKATLELAKLENKVAGLKLDNLDILAKQVTRLKDLTAATEGTGLFAKLNTEITQFKNKKGEIQSVFQPLLANLTALPLKVNEAAQLTKIALINFNNAVSETISGGLSNALAGIGEAFGNALASGGNVLQALGSTLLGALGGILVDLGKLAIQTGIGILAVKTALKSLNPAVAIAAGVALVALGSAFSKGASKLGSSGGGGNFGSGGGASSSSNGGVSTSYSPSQSQGGRVIFEIGGDKLIGVLNNTLRGNERIGTSEGDISFG